MNIYLCFTRSLLFFLLSWGTFYGDEVEANFSLALRAYQKALQTTNNEQKTALLNEALSLYFPYERQGCSGKVLSNIGDVYFLLGRYGYAIGYYRRALNAMPEDSLIAYKLHKAITTANVENAQIEPRFFQSLGSRWWNPYSRTLIAIGLMTITGIIISLHIWFPLVGFSIPWKLSALVTSCYLLLMFLNYVFKGTTAVVLVSSPLVYPANVQERISGEIVEPGQMVYVGQCDTATGMVEVTTVSGIRGSLAQEKLMMIEVP